MNFHQDCQFKQKKCLICSILVMFHRVLGYQDIFKTFKMALNLFHMII